MKRLFTPNRKRSEGEGVAGEQGNTLDRIVKDKEGIRRRLEEDHFSSMDRSSSMGQ